MLSLSDYTLVPDKNGKIWVMSNSGSTAVAVRGETEYRVKLHRRYPPKAGTEMADRNVAACKALCTRLRKLNTSLKKADGGENCIAYATSVLDERTGENAGILELVPTVKGGTPLDRFSGDFRRRLALLKSLADAMMKLHDANIRHGDIKPQNVLCVRHADCDKAVLIDFDHSYPANEVPDGFDIGGTPGFQPPEVLEYIDFYDEEEMTFRAMAADPGKRPDARQKLVIGRAEAIRRKISLRSDIFALGVLFYWFLTNEFPFSETGVRVQRDKLNGADWLCELIKAMLRTNPNERPTAAEVSQAMREETWDDGRPPIEDLWPEHADWEYDLKNAPMKVVRIRRAEERGEKVYALTYEGRTPRTYTLAMLKKIRVVRPKTAASRKAPAPMASFRSEPAGSVLWPEDEAIYKLDESLLARQGYVRVECRTATVLGREVHRYAFIRADGSVSVKEAFLSVQQGFLVRK